MGESTYNVDGDDAGVEVDSQATNTNVGAETLGQRPIAKLGGSKKRWDSLRDQHTTGGVEVGRDVVAEDRLEDLLGRLVVVFWDLFERAVGGREDGDVSGLGRVQGFDDIGESVDELGELGGVVGGRDELVDG